MPADRVGRIQADAAAPQPVLAAAPAPLASPTPDRGTDAGASPFAVPADPSDALSPAIMRALADISGSRPSRQSSTLQAGAASPELPRPATPPHSPEPSNRGQAKPSPVAAIDETEAIAITVISIATALGLGFVVWMLRRRNRERDTARRFSRAVQLAAWEVSAHKKQLQARRAELIRSEHGGSLDQPAWFRELETFCHSQIVPALAREGLSGQWLLIEPTTIRMIEDAASETIGQTTTDGYDGDPEVLGAGLISIDYERYCATLLDDNGWSTQLMAARGDNGGEVVAKKDGNILVLSCRLCNGPIDSSVLTEVSTARQHYRANFVAVVSNAAFTAAACQFAVTNGIFLLHHDDLRSFSFADFTRNLRSALGQTPHVF